MNKKELYLTAAVWFSAVIVSLWWDIWLINLTVAFISVCLGCWILYRDPRTLESKRAGYKTIGLVFVAFGVVRLAFGLYERFLL